MYGRNCMNQPWSDLFNAHHIDWVLASLKDNPDLWDAAWEAARDAARDAAWGAARNAARETAWYAVRGAARHAAGDAVWDAVWDAARDAVWDAARDAVIALVAYDHAGRYLEMSSNELRVWATLSEDPAAVLLLPAVIALEKNT